MKNKKSKGILIVISLLVTGCYSTFQTAKTTRSSLTVGRMFLTEKESEEKGFWVIVAKKGRPAKKGSLGFDVGFTLYGPFKGTDYSGEKFTTYGFTQDFKLQVPENDLLDIAFDTEFFYLRPSNLSILISKDFSPWFSFYGEYKWMYVFQDKTSDHKRLTIGTKINIRSDVSFFLERSDFISGYSIGEAEPIYGIGLGFLK